MKTIKPLMWVFGVQTLLILFLVVQTVSLDRQVLALSVKTDRLATAPAATAMSTPQSPAQSQAVSSAQYPSLDDIRAIIAEEIQTLNSDRSATGMSKSAPSAKAEPTIATADSERQVADVYAKISTLSGAVSASELAAVEFAIAQLPPGDREKALNQLLRDVNSGKIETRF